MVSHANDPPEVSEQQRWEVQADAKRRGITVHFARIFDLCVEKGSELRIGHPERKFKGRAVLQGDQVRDQHWDVAMFQDLSSFNDNSP